MQTDALAKTLLRNTETCFDLLQRKKHDPIHTMNIAPLAKELLTGGEILEIFGVSQVGKTELAIQLILNCAMPSRAVGLKFYEIPANQKPIQAAMNVLIFDNDFQFNPLRLTVILESRIQQAVFATLSEQKQQDVLQDPTKIIEYCHTRFQGEENYKNFINSCLSHVSIVRCKNAFHFWMQAEQLMQEAKQNQVHYRLIVVDSLNTWRQSKEEFDRACVLLCRLAKEYNVTIVATKSPTSRKRDHSEFMHHEWSKNLSMRLNMQGTECKVGQASYKYAIEDSGMEFA